jgi:cytochrome c553
MKRSTTVILALSLTAVASAAADAAAPRQPKAPGIESPGYEWNAPIGEKVEALRRKGNAERGREAYQLCQGCHKPDGSGLRDGTYPQLAGQHATVLIKQMEDIREGRRDNPKMFPFAGKHVINVQEVADIAVYLQGLPIPSDNGKGPGKDLARGKALYDKDCVICHGKNGEGDAKKFYPVLAGQHYAFLLRQAREIRELKRRNANPKMVKVVENYSDADLEAVCDYMSRIAPRPAPAR